MVRKLLQQLTWVHWAWVVGLAVALLAYVGGRRFWEGVDEAEVRRSRCWLGRRMFECRFFRC